MWMVLVYGLAFGDVGTANPAIGDEETEGLDLVLHDERGYNI
jgi:hypothetical protein